MFYEFTRETRPQFAPQETAPQARRGGGACGTSHTRADGYNVWHCSLEREHRGAHVAIYMPGSEETDGNRVCAFWDEDRSTDEGTAAAIRDYIPAPGGDQSHRPGDFVSGARAEGVGPCTAPNAQHWACTRAEGHTGEHIATEGEFMLALWAGDAHAAAPAPENATEEAPAEEPTPLLGSVVRAVAMYPNYSPHEGLDRYVGRLGVAIREEPDDDGDLRVAFYPEDQPLTGLTAAGAERSDAAHYYVREWEVLTPEQVAAHDADLAREVGQRETATAQEKLDALWEALGKEANDRGWCTEYDQFAAKHGGPARPTDWNVRVRLAVRVPRESVVAGYVGTGLYTTTHEVTVRVTGETESDARERTPAALRASNWKGDLEAFIRLERREY